MKLIDADKLIEDLEKVKKESESLVDIAHIIGFQSVIDAQPTAFDVDKVIEELEDKYGCTSCDFHEEECKHDKHCFIYEMIDVVKAGGIDE